ncbi:MAG TPA: alpha/beta hydrolase [Acetobacteraceae bacterium]|nr:alpha/beta hydrolase [Acetobacteraceae bacterium]
MTVDGVNLHYIDRGKGSPVVLLHGNGALARDWEVSGVVDLLAANHRVIAFDRPGFGYSDRPRGGIWDAAGQAALIHKALVRLDIRSPVIVGHSWGTLVALALALDNKRYSKGLVLLSGYYYPRLRADVTLLSGPAIPIFGDLLRYTIVPLLGWVLWDSISRKLFAPAPVSQRFRTDFPMALALRPSQLRASAADTALMVPVAASFLDRHEELDVPVAIMAGNGDRIVDIARQSKRLHAELPKSFMHELEGAGHMIHYIAPEAVAAVITSIAHRAGTNAPE